MARCKAYVLFWIAILSSLLCVGHFTLAQDRPPTNVLIHEVVSLQLQNIDARYHYRYNDEEIIEDIGPDGNPKHFETTTMQWMHTDFGSYVKYLAINGAAYPPQVLADQQTKIDQQIRDVASKSPDQQQALRTEATKERNKEKDFIRSLPEAAAFEFAGEQTINGHPSWIFSFSPRPGFHPPSRETNFLKSLSGKIWITQNEHQLARLTGALQEDVDFGAGLFGSVKKASTITLEQLPVPDGYWFPSFTEMEFRAKILVKGQNKTEISRYTHYEKVSDPRKKIEVEKLP